MRALARGHVVPVKDNSVREVRYATHVEVDGVVGESERGGPLSRGVEKVGLVRSLAATAVEIDAVRASGRRLDPEDERRLGVALALFEAVPLVNRPWDRSSDLAVALGRVTSDDLRLVGGLLNELRSDGTAAASVASFDARMKVEPLGRLHLERIEMRPAGVERGELVASVPLAPGENVTVSHREWSARSTELAESLRETLSEISEESTASKSELATSTETQSQRARAYSLSGSYSYAGTASVQFSASTSSEDSQAAEQSRTRMSETTRKAASRAVRDQKRSFVVGSQEEVEDSATQSITNPGSEPMRIDYFRLMRKWRVDALRYGLRMTYDLVVPSPGNRLLERHVELVKLNKILNQSFRFDLQIEDVTADNFDELHQRFGGDVAAPPPATKPFNQASEMLELNGDDWNSERLVVSIEDGYELAGGTINAEFGSSGEPRLFFAGLSGEKVFNQAGVFDRFRLDIQPLIGLSGDLPLLYRHRNTSAGAIVADLELSLTSDAFIAWQRETLEAFRDAASETFREEQLMAAERRQDVLDELAGQDALTLRQLETESIQESVVGWLLGPSFAFGPPHEQPNTLDTQTEPVMPQSTWMETLGYGEFIKFVHNAVEWENVLFFTYPPFWHGDEAEGPMSLKFDIDHPDSRHRDFLRASAARVVLTIRPGFEMAFTKLVEEMVIDNEPLSGSPYVPIVEEMRNHAARNYPGIPPANLERSVRPLLFPQQRKAWRTLEQLLVLIDHFFERAGDYPDGDDWFTTLEAEAALIAQNDPTATDPHGVAWPEVELASTDPWGHSWIYANPGREGEFDLKSLGATHEVGGEGIDAEIPATAEAALIGQWFEYTPTPALDIQVDSDLDTLA